MLRPILFSLSLLALGACREDPKPNLPPEAPPAQPSPAAKGTSIEFGYDGVKVESKAGEVELGKDTARLVLPK